MPFRVVAHDIDGTITDNGEVIQATYDAIRRLKALQPGIQIWAISGRTADCFEFKGGNPIIAQGPLRELWDVVIADNGGTVIYPKTGEIVRLAKPFPAAAVSALRPEIDPLWVGETMIATFRNHDPKIRSELRRLNLSSEIHTEFNRNWVMYGTTTADGHRVNKAYALRQLCQKSGVKLKDVIGFGDAENDFSFLRICGLGVAVGDAEVKLRDITGLTATYPAGAGFRQILQLLQRNQQIEDSGQQLAA